MAGPPGNAPGGLSSYGMPLLGSGFGAGPWSGMQPFFPAKVFFVDSGATDAGSGGGAGRGERPDKPFSNTKTLSSQPLSMADPFRRLVSRRGLNSGGVADAQPPRSSCTPQSRSRR